MTYSSPIPQIGLGTFGRTGEEGIAAILEAIAIGYRHIDTAQSYGTEISVGEAIRQSGVPRSEFFVTTKVADTKLDATDFLPSVEQSLETLGFEQVDLLLIHWPSQNDQVPFESYMTGLAEAKVRGWARHIGVSNFNTPLLDQARNLLGDNVIATNQVEIHPYLQTPLLRDYARARGLMLTAYQPLCKGAVHNDPVLREIGERHGVSAAAIALAFLMAEGHAVIPASANAVNLKSNFAALGVSLSEAELGSIRALERNERRINPAKSPRWDD